MEDLAARGLLDTLGAQEAAEEEGAQSGRAASRRGV